MYRNFWNLFVKEYGGFRNGLSLFAVTLGVALMEGLNIGILIPLLETLKSPGEEGGHWVSRALAGFFDTLGIPFELWTLLLALGLLVFVITGLKYLRLILLAKSIQRFVVWLRSWTMGRLLNADMSYIHSESLGRLSDTAIAQTGRAGNSLRMFAEIGANIGVVLAYLAAAMIITPVLTGVALGMMILVSLAVQRLVTKARIMAVTQVQQENELQVIGLENLSGLHVVRSFLLERLRGMAFMDGAQRLADTTFHLERNRSQILIIQEIALFGLIGAIVLVGVSVLSLDVTLIVTLLFILYRMTPRITALNAQRQTLQVVLASLEQVKQITERAGALEITSGEKPFLKLHHGIQLRSVNFSYNGSSQVLHDTSFTIEAGKMTAIIGTSGAGKTTLIDLLLRFYDPVGGTVLVDGVDLRELDLESWRGSIGVVSQDVFLFNDTIANNINLGRLGASQESIETAACQAYAHDFIMDLPEKYETRVGDRGWNLSGGQRQRVALARAILKDPEILIMDEATSSLDSESEQLIQRYLREIRGTRTIVVVAHRMSTIQDADKIVVLQDGKIVEEGQWDSLVKKEGVLANFQRLQSGS